MDNFDLLRANTTGLSNKTPEASLAIRQRAVIWWRVCLLNVGANFVPLTEQAVKENRRHIHYLEARLTMECEWRDQHTTDSRVSDAQLQHMKTLEEFVFAQAL
ncbi:MAG: hypothetical protein ABSE51_23315 [Terracidiphilus sp.]